MQLLMLPVCVSIVAPSPSQQWYQSRLLLLLALGPPLCVHCLLVELLLLPPLLLCATLPLLCATQLLLVPLQRPTAAVTAGRQLPLPPVQKPDAAACAKPALSFSPLCRHLLVYFGHYTPVVEEGLSECIRI